MMDPVRQFTSILARENGVSEEIAHRLVKHYSNGDKRAMHGLMGVKEHTGKRANGWYLDLQTAMEKLSILKDRYEGDEIKAAAAYVATPERVDRCGLSWTDLIPEALAVEAPPAA